MKNGPRSTQGEELRLGASSKIPRFFLSTSENPSQVTETLVWTHQASNCCCVT